MRSFGRGTGSFWKRLRWLLNEERKKGRKEEKKVCTLRDFGQRLA
jgi:hypothetical protein